MNSIQGYKVAIDKLISNMYITLGIYSYSYKEILEKTEIIQESIKNHMDSFVESLRTLTYITSVCEYKGLEVLEFQLRDGYDMKLSTFRYTLSRGLQERTAETLGREYYRNLGKKFIENIEGVQGLTYPKESLVIDKVYFLYIVLQIQEGRVEASMVGRFLVEQYDLYLTTV